MKLDILNAQYSYKHKLDHDFRRHPLLPDERDQFSALLTRHHQTAYKRVKDPARPLFRAVTAIDSVVVRGYLSLTSNAANVWRLSAILFILRFYISFWKTRDCFVGNCTTLTHADAIWLSSEEGFCANFVIFSSLVRLLCWLQKDACRSWTFRQLSFWSQTTLLCPSHSRPSVVLL